MAEIDPDYIERLAYVLLDSDNGISEEAYGILCEVLPRHSPIRTAVRITDGVAYLKVD
jgi:hypothetical protein